MAREGTPLPWVLLCVWPFKMALLSLACEPLDMRLSRARLEEKVCVCVHTCMHSHMYIHMYVYLETRSQGVFLAHILLFFFSVFPSL